MPMAYRELIGAGLLDSPSACLGLLLTRTERALFDALYDVRERNAEAWTVCASLARIALGPDYSHAVVRQGIYNLRKRLASSRWRVEGGREGFSGYRLVQAEEQVA